MSALILDIETAALPSKNFNKQTLKIIQDKLFKELEADSSKKPEDFFGLSPYTGQIVTIGTVDADSGRGAVYYLDPTGKADDKDENGIIFRSYKTENELIEKFWDLSKNFTVFVTFNGRTFDIPFLNIRSAIHKIRPKHDLMQGRYLYQQRGVQHIDIYDQLTYYNGFRFPTGGSLHMACQAFGITTPKEGDIDGSKVTPMFNAGQYREIAEYNCRDILATKTLYDYWRKYLAL